MSNTPTLAELEAAMRCIYDEAGRAGQGGALLTLDVVQPVDMPELLTAALLNGDPAAQSLFARTSRAIRDVYDAPRKLPKLCACCPRRIRRGTSFSVVLVTPGCDDPTMALALVVCLKCGPDRMSIKAKAAEALKRFWPDLRDVTPTHRGGHA